MNTRNNQTTKKVYATPKIVVYGSIGELTKAASGRQPKPQPQPPEVSRTVTVCTSNCG
jgi:hypothetical protein